MAIGSLFSPDMRCTQGKYVGIVRIHLADLDDEESNGGRDELISVTSLTRSGCTPTRGVPRWWWRASLRWRRPTPMMLRAAHDVHDGKGQQASPGGRGSTRGPRRCDQILAGRNARPGGWA